IIGVLMLSSMLNVAYLLPVFARGFVGGGVRSDTREKGLFGGIAEAPLFCVVPLCLTALGCLVLFFYAGSVEAFLTPLVDGSAASATESE
ncbi:MAG: monovalent cation/H+ antiporter subunit D family protein, partial [Pseudomonadota bacterium]